MLPPVHTIGHSTRPIEDFIELLRRAGVTRLVDVRAVPRSRFNPQYNREALERALREAGIDYRHMAELGGMRKPRSDSPNGFWPEGFRGYADYALTPEFRAALAALEALAEERPTAIMCAEKDWRKCHRQLIADNLMVDGLGVCHILDDGIEAAEMNPAAKRRPDGTLIYPPRAPDDRAPRLPGL